MFRLNPSLKVGARTCQGTSRVICNAHTVTVKMLDGTQKDLQIEDGEAILDAMLDAGLDATHDCKMGVCMTCPAKVVSGEVDQAAGMLSEDVREKGYALMCVSTPLSDCTIHEIEESEILEEQLCA